jgi:two-component system CheB/CheR fusion protein
MAARKHAKNDKAPAPAPGERRPDFAVVGMGASAGGLDAFKRFFAVMPSRRGLAFVLVQHLDPTHESLMVELLAKHTAMKVVEVKNQMAIEPNHVYMIPPNKYLAVSKGVLQLSEPAERRGMRMPIDFFFRSLAEDQQERAIGILLSGTGTEGTLGLKAIHGNGGMAMVQDPGTAPYDGMPRSAIATGVVDYVLPVEKMPETLLRYVSHAYGRRAPRPVAARGPDILDDILTLVREHTQRDFRGYKKMTLSRRIQRRMSVNHIDQPRDYLTFLRDRPAEVALLFKDLLIGVTGFFREPEAWEVLSGVAIPELLKHAETDRPLRAWVPGCATGEEAFSLAILLHEQITLAQKRIDVRLFASDIDEDALEFARAGVYPDSILTDLSPERLGRYFTPAGDHSFQVNKQLREAIVFAVQNVISDPPFSKLDLISCRNLLIYLEPEIQKKMLLLLHFALKPGGYLFLGSSETVSQRDGLFEPVAGKWQIFRRLGVERQAHFNLPLASTQDKPGARRQPAGPARAEHANVADIARQALLDHCAPASVLINPAYDVVYFHGMTGNYLDLPVGAPTRNVFALARAGLRAKLRAAIHGAARERNRVSARDIPLRRNGHTLLVTVTVQPLGRPGQDECLYLVSFEDEVAATPPAPAAEPAAGDERLVRQLEYELQCTREDLQTTIEELETSNEELRASNEEVMSANEELQSTNEELETSKEELQSLNEEMSTVNSQLREKVGELEGTTSDLDNLLTSTEMAVIFLDTSFRIKRFTAATTRLLNLIATDVGRPITDLAARFSDDRLLNDAQAVLDQLTPIAKEITVGDDSWYLRRILPYRAHGNRIEGVVLTFVDVTPVKKADLQRKELNEARLQKQLADAALREQERLGQELHDTVGQALTGISMMAKSLESALRARAPGEAGAAGTLVEHIQNVLKQVGVIARGLSPVEIDAEGLADALAEIARVTRDRDGIPCRFECNQRPAVKANNTAAQLYLIAREAVTNAVKHACPHEIAIRLTRDAKGITLCIENDGVGIGAGQESGTGLGLRIMRYRAGAIGGQLHIGAAKSGGTSVTCTLKEDD